MSEQGAGPGADDAEGAERVFAFIEHPRITELFARLDILRQIRRCATHSTEIDHLIVAAVAGVGKTEAAHKYCEKNPATHRQTRDVRPVVMFTMPSPFALSAFYRAILRALGVPILAARPSLEDLCSLAVLNLKAQSVEMLLIDEAENIGGGNRPLEYGLEAIKYLANEANVVLVLFGVPKIVAYRNIDQQYIRRFRVFHLDQYQECDEDFAYLIEAAGDVFGFPEETQIWSTERGVLQEIHRLTEGKLWGLMRLLWALRRTKGLTGDTRYDLIVRKTDIVAAYAKFRESWGEADAAKSAPKTVRVADYDDEEHQKARQDPVAAKVANSRGKRGE